MFLRGFWGSANSDDMNYAVLAEKARYFKQDEKGVAAMCKMMEDMRNETTKDNARRLLRLGKIKVNEIPECFPELSENDIRELESEVTQSA
ncbi:MAG: hypothetical protein NC123_15370 [Butyrivibrio sp.]|nr:hypothetical protein [Acetatifactor muris]MCM1560900.1 hypothetical protein [Butyrivibrio sp.]